MPDEDSRAPTFLFDVMDTLIHDPFYREIPAFFGWNHAELMQHRHPTAWEEFERGQITEGEYLSRWLTGGRTFDSDAFRAWVREAYQWLPGMEELISELRGRGYEIHAFSNYPVWYRLIEEKLRLSRYLKWSLVSCNTGLRKPSHNAFEMAAQTVGRPPCRCVFIDDSSANCDAARAIGMVAIRFVDAPTLYAELRRTGL
jgi:HAD superfamily hydrolase (TIGR01509 family)